MYIFKMSKSAVFEHLQIFLIPAIFFSRFMDALRLRKSHFKFGRFQVY